MAALGDEVNLLDDWASNKSVRPRVAFNTVLSMLLKLHSLEWR